ncbi:Peptidylprolyl isomerase [Abeliophyllum distichum]|uniref:Peptidylprolyl isomerase n=1 Tax=Abeliophyllum distichum TaxID=126358 RepID=A0ABD1NYS5_9LAMI
MRQIRNHLKVEGKGKGGKEKHCVLRGPILLKRRKFKNLTVYDPFREVDPDKRMMLHWQSMMPERTFFEDLHDQSRWLTGDGIAKDTETLIKKLNLSKERGPSSLRELEPMYWEKPAKHWGAREQENEDNVKFTPNSFFNSSSELETFSDQEFQQFDAVPNLWIKAKDGIGDISELFAFKLFECSSAVGRMDHLLKLWPFSDESPKLKHDRPGLLSMGIANQDGCGSLFSVTLKADHRLDRKCVVFGTLVDGHDMLKRIENAGNEEGKPTVTVKIVNSGEVKDDKKKGNKLKLGKDTVEANNHEERPKGKHRKSSKKGRKRRRYFKSESDSSSDTDSSESYSAFDSDASSLRDTSSSSDDRHTKRKRSKKDGHRYIKRKDKRCKRNDKKAKHRSKKSSPRSLSRSATASPPRRRVTGSPPHASSRRSSLKSASRSPVRPSRRSLSRNSGKPSRRSPSRSPIRLPRISASRSSGRATPRRIPSPSPARAASRSNRRSYTRSPVKSGCGVRTPVPDRCRSSSRRPVDGSPQRIRRGRGFSDRYTYARRYRSRSPYCSSVRSYRYGGRSDYGRYSSYRRSPRRYRSPPKGRAPLSVPLCWQVIMESCLNRTRFTGLVWFTLLKVLNFTCALHV